MLLHERILLRDLSTLITRILYSSSSLLLSCKIEPQELAEILLQSLPDLYDQVIINLTSNVLSDYLVFTDVAATILEEENRRNNREARQTSSRQVEALVVTRGRSMEPGSSGSHNHVLEYVPEQGMKILVERKLLLGLTKVSLPLCEHCVINKQHRLKFNTSNSRSVFVLELIHFDVWQAPVLSLGGAKKKIMCLRMYYGGEYTSDEIDTFCMQEGIKRQFTTAYTPQQNRVAERMNRTLLERARAILATTSIGKSFWAEAVNIACYVINRLPSTAVELKTPMEMCTGKPINYSDLHIFGSPVYVMYNTQETTKLDPKSKKCLFLRYADGVKGYRLWDPTSHKVVASRDVVFMEDKIQEDEEGDSTTRKITSIQMEKEFQSNDYFEAAPQHEVNETNESQAPATRILNSERKRPRRAVNSSRSTNNPDASFWKKAKQEEIEALHKNKTWELVPLPGGRTPIGNKWVYKIKRNDDDQVERYRARLLVKGYAQKEGIDFNKKNSPVV
ncbi:gag-pol polyprotein [Tanacetum coccineum]|uniref:Gag-pol polyprotein n=1 Tax=Tanacetum coccineum TaxID=301880 RepID=A0ABQ4YR73_9ASTR